MTRTHVKRVLIDTGKDQAALSKGQKAFNTLIRQIEKKRSRLAAWEAALPPYQQKYAGEMVGLLDESLDVQVEMVHCLDRASGWAGLTKTERREIESMIIELAVGLVAARDDAQLKAIYNRHSRSDYDAEEAAGMEGMKTLLEDVLGVELGDDFDIDSPEDMLGRARAAMRESQAQYDAEREERKARLSMRKKSPKQLAREAQQEADERQLRQSISEIYRKLASALHPDREPDPLERERKTALMKRANLAYEKNNLLQLLELQLELEHIDQSALGNISEDRLKHYNRILKEQLAELDQEILRIEDGFRAQFSLDPFESVSPGSILRELSMEIVEVQRCIRDAKKDLLAFENVKTLKAWLRALRRRPRVDDIGEFPF